MHARHKSSQYNQFGCRSGGVCGPRSVKPMGNECGPERVGPGLVRWHPLSSSSAGPFSGLRLPAVIPPAAAAAAANLLRIPSH
uniref:Uncharacterized protein n=1 Tax=Leersia perrieri TaxID=77586 RepID=A0A0D9UW14_9ORYZ